MLGFRIQRSKSLHPVNYPSMYTMQAPLQAEGTCAAYPPKDVLGTWGYVQASPQMI